MYADYLISKFTLVCEQFLADSPGASPAQYEKLLQLKSDLNTAENSQTKVKNFLHVLHASKDFLQKETRWGIPFLNCIRKILRLPTLPTRETYFINFSRKIDAIKSTLDNPANIEKLKKSDPKLFPTRGSLKIIS